MNILLIQWILWLFYGGYYITCERINSEYLVETVLQFASAYIFSIEVSVYADVVDNSKKGITNRWGVGWSLKGTFEKTKNKNKGMHVAYMRYKLVITNK